MCLDGQPLPFSCSPSRAATSFATGATSQQHSTMPNSNSSLPTPSPPQRSLKNAVWWLRRMREIGERSAPGQALALRRASLTVLFLLSSPACSLLKPKLPEAPAPAACPIVQCLDRALETCTGVDPRPVHTCADAVLIASDALGEVVVCQESHAALIRCVEQFNFDHGR